MWLKEKSSLLRKEIDLVLDSLSNTGEVLLLAKESLTESNRALAADLKNNRPWALLPLIVCESVSGQFERAIPAAACLQFLMVAADILDDIEDQDSSKSLVSKYGMPLATNTASLLYSLAWKTIARLRERKVADDTIVIVVDTIGSFCIKAGIGQHLDLYNSKKHTANEAAYLKLVAMKSATQIECACVVGSLIGGIDNKLIGVFSKFGYNIGMAAQIANDILGITRKGDILKPKMTLPLIYSITHAEENPRRKLESLFFKSRGDEPFEAKEISDILFQSGAIHYATVKMEYYKQQANRALKALENNGVQVDELKLFTE
jgi:geranylgeranyl diphosphate synthase, type I